MFPATNILKEWEIGLDEEVLRKNGISICQLIYFNNKNFVDIFGVRPNEAIPFVQKLHEIRIQLENFLKT